MYLQRKMGFWEIIRGNVNNMQYGTSNIVIFARVFGELTPKLFTTVLELLFDRHPLLRARESKIAAEEYYVCDRVFSDIPVQITNRKSENSYLDIINTELNNPLKIDNYCWRANLVYNQNNILASSECVFTFHHGMSDGLSLVYFISDFLEYCSLISQGKNIPKDSLPLLNPIEKLLGKNISWLEYKNRLENNSEVKFESWLYNTFMPLGERKTRIVCRKLEKNQLARLRQHCHIEKVTVNSLFSSALLLSGYLNKIHKNTFSFLTLVDLRRYCHPVIELNNFGCYVTSVITKHTLDENKLNVWEIAREFQSNLKNHLTDELFPPNDFISSDLKNLSISNPKGEVLKNNSPPLKFSLDFSISNLGYINLRKEYPPFALDFLYFCTSRQVGDIGLMINMVSLQGGTFMSFNYTEPLLSDEIANKLISTFIEIINNI